MIVFCLFQLINVILGTLRSICTVKSGVHIGMLINTISYTFYAIVTKLLTEQSLISIVVVTAITNCIGYYAAQFIFKKMQKPKLWRITATINKQKEVFIYEQLERYNIPYNAQTLDNCNMCVIDIFSANQRDSALIKDILQECHAKYHVIEIEKTLQGGLIMFYCVCIQFTFEKVIRVIPKKNKKKIFKNVSGHAKYYIAAKNSEIAKFDGITQLQKQIKSKDFLEYFYYEDKTKMTPWTTFDFYVVADIADLNIDKCSVTELTAKEALEHFSIEKIFLKTLDK